MQEDGASGVLSFRVIGGKQQTGSEKERGIW